MIYFECILTYFQKFPVQINRCWQYCSTWTQTISIQHPAVTNPAHTHVQGCTRKECERHFNGQTLSQNHEASCYRALISKCQLQSNHNK